MSKLRIRCNSSARITGNLNMSEGLEGIEELDELQNLVNPWLPLASFHVRKGEG